MRTERIRATPHRSVMINLSIPPSRGARHHPGMALALPEFPARLKQAREALGISQGELSRRAGCRPETVSRYESGANPTPRIGELVAIATVLGRSIDWLLGDSDPSDDQIDDITWAAEQASLDALGVGKLRAVVRQVGPMARAELLSTASRIAENAAKRTAMHAADARRR